MAKRPLTTGEIEMARSVFKDSIDYSRVRISDKVIFPLIQKKGRAMAGHNVVSFPGPSYRYDFSAETDPVRRSVFIHEMAHVWQHQTGVLHTYRSFMREMMKHKFNNSALYRYTLDPARDLTSYGLEQQAMILQDYFLLTRHGLVSSHRRVRSNAERGVNLRALFEKVLERFNADPSYGRAYKKAQRKPRPPWMP
jgi:hypothetical protein